MVMPWIMVGLFAAQVDVATMPELQAALDAAQPGDEIIVHAGTYTSTGFWGVNLQGTETDPIIVRAADGEAVVIEGIPSQNIIDIGGTWYQWRGFEMVGGSHGVRVGTSSHAVFEDLHIHDTGDVGISCNRPGETYEDITIRGLQIHHTNGTGECMYLGCNDDGCQVFDSLVEYNWCHDTGGSQGDGIELKTGSYNTIIRHNVIHDVIYPGITMYGTVGRAPNLVEGNIVWNVVDNGIQTVGDVTLHNNVVFDTGGDGIHIQPSQGQQPIGVIVRHNTVANAGAACLRGNDFPAGNGNVIANNALLCTGGEAIRLVNAAEEPMLAGNAVSGALTGVTSGTFDVGDAAAELSDAAGYDAYPSDGSALRDACMEPEALEVDFNCSPRDDASRDVGAYEWSQSGNPGWLPTPGFKPPCAAPPGGSDTGGDSTGGDPGGDTSGGDTNGDPTGAADGNDGTGTGASGTGGTGGTAGADAGAGDGSGGGCGCRHRDPASTPLGLALWVLGVGLWIRPGRRSPPSPACGPAPPRSRLARSGPAC